MKGRSFTILLSGSEELASTVVAACEEELPCDPPFVSRTPGDMEGWRVIVRPRLAACGETDWVDVARALTSAMSSFDMTMEHPCEKELRERLDRLLPRVRSLLDRTPGASAHIALQGRKPVALRKAKSTDLAWRLVE